MCFPGTVLDFELVIDCLLYMFDIFYFNAN